MTAELRGLVIQDRCGIAFFALHRVSICNGRAMLVGCLNSFISGFLWGLPPADGLLPRQHPLCQATIRSLGVTSLFHECVFDRAPKCCWPFWLAADRGPLPGNPKCG